MNTRLIHSRGHTLLELSIALALGLLILAASLSVYRAQRAGFERAADAAHIHDAGVGALDLVAQQVQMAGFSAAGATDAPLFGCSQGRVTGAETSASCESLASHSDGLQVRYAADTVSTWPSTSGTPTDCIGQTVSDAFVFNRYYAKPSTSSGEPELYCEGGGRQAQPLVEGVERMRVVYWIAGAPAAIDASAIARERWPDVYAAEVCVLVRGAAIQAKRRANYVDCDGAPAVSDDGRTRMAFWRTVGIRNARGAS
ncbi:MULTISPECIES: PilW family protein [unclassified Caballeronia]|uniref:PilW family protein n=1 Tax=unclassified Caballeronia TaxID=2646786 RepID=UPI0028589A47|nr:MULTISPECIES: PilW family protein [unclassified Caballeronia]MDR5772450.1 PilW family protein [Caballeronia sp. LZ002]MDR5804105.1 PilW family protein [Caballeronia sp. LZ001]MDR5847884.1 PilW family protein [Caballeronia sp. LZ003]